ncbi:MAG: type II secretion system protein [Tepidisphaeraceae bacterium]
MKRAFTLIELLVTIGVIALLIAILVPTLSKARASAQRTTCRAQLHDLGKMFQMYLNDNKQRVMRVNPLPSDPTLLGYDAPSIVDVFAPYHRGAKNVFRCPSDSLIKASATTRAKGGATYFECEGTSYEYNAFFNAYAIDPRTGVNEVWVEALAEAGRRPPLGLKPVELPLLVDFEAFHGKLGVTQSRNALYADFHVNELTIGVPKGS